MTWSLSGVVPAGTTTWVINLSGRAPQTAWRWQVIRSCWSTALGQPIKHRPELSLWQKPTSCLHFELLTPTATSFICQSVTMLRCHRSVFSQPGNIDNKTVAGGWQARFMGCGAASRSQPQTGWMWHHSLVSACPRSIQKNGSRALWRVKVCSRQWGVALGCMCGVSSADHAVKWKVLVHNHKPSWQ